MDKKAPKIRIESDGTPNGTRVYAASGEELKYITAVELSIDINEALTRATLHLLNVGGSLEATLDALAVKTIPAPAEEHVLTIYAARWTWRGRRSRLTLNRQTNGGTDYTLVEPVVRCLIPPSEPCALRFAGEPAAYKFLSQLTR